jgi:hypothetical protein
VKGNLLSNNLLLVPHAHECPKKSLEDGRGIERNANQLHAVSLATAKPRIIETYMMWIRPPILAPDRQIARHKVDSQTHQRGRVHRHMPPHGAPRVPAMVEESRAYDSSGYQNQKGESAKDAVNHNEPVVAVVSAMPCTHSCGMSAPALAVEYRFPQ